MSADAEHSRHQHTRHLFAPKLQGCQIISCRQLQEKAASKDALLNELRHKADQAAVDQLCKRTQAMTGTASTMNLAQKNLESRMIAVEKRLEYELTVAVGESRNPPLVTAVNTPADTNTSCESP